MAAINENVMPSSDDKCILCMGKCTVPQERGVTLSNWIKLLLLFLGVSVVFFLGSVCALRMDFFSKYSLCDTPIDQHNVSKLQSDSEQNAMVSCLSDTERQMLKQRIKELLLSCLEFTVPPLSYKPCEEGWRAYRGKCYTFSSNMQSWFESRDSCAASQAHLVIIESAVEQAFLLSKNIETYWIGLSDLETEGHWIWVNNQTLSETGVEFWFRRGNQKSEPDNWNVDDPSGENCASVSWEALNAWFDNSCTVKKKYICEKKYSFPYLDDNESN